MLLSNLESLQSTLSEVIPHCEDQDKPDAHQAVSGVLKALHRLLGMIMDIKQIVAGYVEIWKPNGPLCAAPQLNPLLYRLCTTCALRLSKLQTYHQLVANAKDHSKCLNKLCDDLSMFLPIFRVDVDEYQTLRTNFPKYPTEVLPSHRIYVHRRYRSTEPQPAVDGPIPALRGRLYALKDEVGKSNRVISNTLVTEVFNGDTEKQLREIQALQIPIFRALGVLLSNHGSDWIEQTIAGGMSYAEFTNLDGKEIQATEARISEFGKHLDVLRCSCSSSRVKSGHPIPNEYFLLRGNSEEHMYDRAKGAKNIRKSENADVDPAALDYEGVKAMLLELNSMLKIEAE